MRERELVSLSLASRRGRSRTLRRRTRFSSPLPASPHLPCRNGLFLSPSLSLKANLSIPSLSQSIPFLSVRWQSFHWRDTTLHGTARHGTTRARTHTATATRKNETKRYETIRNDTIRNETGCCPAESGVSNVRGKITGHGNSVCHELKKKRREGKKEKNSARPVVSCLAPRRKREEILHFIRCVPVCIPLHQRRRKRG